MADEEYYYYEGSGDDGEVSWETHIDNDYAAAKGIMDSDPARCIAGMEKVIAGDQDKGQWTFKALKMLARATQRSKQYGKMRTYFDRLINFNYKERSPVAVEKAMNKFFDRCNGTVPPEVWLEICKVSLAMLDKNRTAYEKLWFSVKTRVLQLQLATKLATGQYDQVLHDLGPLKLWCTKSDERLQFRGAQFLTLLSVEIQVYAEREDYSKCLEIFRASLSVTNANPPARVIGVLKECGGKVLMRQERWRQATENFSHALRSFATVGDQRRIHCLKYLVLASMFSHRYKINPFATIEAKSLKDDPEVKAITELISAWTRDDVIAISTALKDPNNVKSLKEDAFLNSYLQPHHSSA